MGKRSSKKRQRSIPTVTEITRRLRRDKVLTEPSTKSDSNRRLVHPGDIFMISDDEFKNKFKEQTHSSIIHYNRPAIVIGVNKKTVTILAMTTKDRGDYDVVYPICIEEGKISYVIVSQPLTIDLDRLNTYKGSIKSDVLRDIKQALTDFISFGSRECESKAPVFALNTFRLVPFRIYKYPTSDTAFILLKVKSRDTYISLDVKLPTEIDDMITGESNDTTCGSSRTDKQEKVLDIFCGRIQFSTIHNANKIINGDDDLLCIGEECDKKTRSKIGDKIAGMYGIRIDDKYTPDLCSSIVLSSLMLSQQFTMSTYMMAYNTINNILDNCSKKYLDNPVEYTEEIFADFNINSSDIMNLINKYLVMNCDPLLCDTRILDIGRDKYSDILESRLANHDDGYILNDKGIVTDYTNATSKFYLKNIRWIYRYHNPKKQNKK